jgi:hypothetical protein
MSQQSDDRSLTLRPGGRGNGARGCGATLALSEPWRRLCRLPLATARVEVKLARNADGIVVLTGGSSRVGWNCSPRLRQAVPDIGRAPTNAVSDISRSLPDNQTTVWCRVDPFRSPLRAAMPLKPGAGPGTRIQLLIVVTSNITCRGHRGIVARDA